MASFLDKLKIKTAVDKRTKLDLGCDHITTADWMQYNVAYNKELVPKEKISVNMQSFLRMLPLNKPTFGRANMNNRAFFVPYRTVWPGWNDFITDAPHIPYTSGSTSTATLQYAVPTIINSTFVSTFINTNNGFCIVNGVSANVHDICVWDNNNSVFHYLKLTPKGRQAMKVLQSLGYAVIWNTADNTPWSSLPLLAAIKVYIDWYWPSAYQNETLYNQLLSYTKIDSSTFAFSDSDVANICNVLLYVNYDSDYFVSAWDNPDGPNKGNYSNVKLTDTTTYKVRTTASSSPSLDLIATQVDNLPISNTTTDVAYRQGNDNGTPVIRTFAQTTNSNVGDVMPISQYILHALHALTDYMKRHQLVGAKALDRYLARFGVKLTDESANRSVYLGSFKVPIQIGDVMSNSDTNGAALAEYAGKGMGYGQKVFEYETDEYGQFIIISTLVPAIGNPYGFDRNNLHITKLDFYTPEFDALGSQAIATGELWTPMSKVEISNAGVDTYPSYLASASYVFGFTPRYAEYKVGHDRLTGDFRYSALNAGEDCWYLYRNPADIYSGIADDSTYTSLVHTYSFGMGFNDWNQYNRIFNTANSNADSFRVIHHFDAVSYAPMSPLFENYEFEDKGKEVVEDVNGVKLN